MNLLFVFSYPRACNYILPTVDILAQSDAVSYFCYRQMATHEDWTDPSVDLRPLVYGKLQKSGAMFLGEPPVQHSETKDNYTESFEKAIKNLKFDLAIFDENLGKQNWGGNLLYRILRKKQIPVVGCQEGSVDDDLNGLKRIAGNLGICYDYCFCLGRFDKEALIANNPNLKDRISAVGLPCNDALSQYAAGPPAEKKHILLVTSYTAKSGPSKIFKPMTDETITRMGILRLSEETGLPVLIKEKAKRWSDACAFGHLRSSRVQVTMDERDLDRIVGESFYVIGAPSTLLFKSIQARIPTAVLTKPYMGRLGVLKEFEGLTDSTYEEICETLHKQSCKKGVGEEFIERAVAGGYHFQSTKLFVNAVHQLYRRARIFSGPIKLPQQSFRKILWARYPKGFKLLQGLYASVRNRVSRLYGRSSQL